VAWELADRALQHSVEDACWATECVELIEFELLSVSAGEDFSASLAVLLRQVVVEAAGMMKSVRPQMQSDPLPSKHGVQEHGTGTPRQGSDASFDQSVLVMGANAAEGDILLCFATRVLEGAFEEATIVSMAAFDLNAKCLAVLFEGFLGSEGLISIAGRLAGNKTLAGCFVEADHGTVAFGVHEFSFELRNQAGCSDFQLVGRDTVAGFGVVVAEGLGCLLGAPCLLLSFGAQAVAASGNGACLCRRGCIWASSFFGPALDLVHVRMTVSMMQGWEFALRVSECGSSIFGSVLDVVECLSFIGWQWWLPRKLLWLPRKLLWLPRKLWCWKHLVRGKRLSCTG